MNNFLASFKTVPLMKDIPFQVSRNRYPFYVTYFNPRKTYFRDSLRFFLVILIKDIIF